MIITQQLGVLGGRVLNGLDGLGRFTAFSGEAGFWTMRNLGKPRRMKLVFPQLFTIGTKSLLVVMLVGAFVGMVLSVETYDSFRRWGQEATLGGVISVSVVRQIGPVLAAVMIAGRVGGAVSAELGSMRVTEQLEAMRAMGVDPVAYLVVPRLLACVIMVPVLTIYSDLLGVAGGYVVTVLGFGVNSADYWRHARDYVQSYDVLSGLFKCVFFGLMIGLISCYKGFNCKPGAQGVGRAATESFVASFVAIIVMNFFLAKFLKDYYNTVIR